MRKVQISKILWSIKKDMAACRWSSGPGLCALIETELEQRLIGSINGLSDYTRACRAVRNAMAEWPEHSGRAAYPVRAPLGFQYDGLKADWDLAPIAYSVLPRWQGEYGGNRMRLLNFLIRYFEAQENA